MPAEYDILHAQGIHSIAVLPIFAAGKFVGFIGLDNPDHAIYDIASKILQVISGHLGCIRSHLDAQETLRESRARLESQLISLRRETYLVDVLASDYRCILRCNLTQDTFETVKGVPRCPTDTSGIFSEWVPKPMTSTSSMPPRRISFPFLPENNFLPRFLRSRSCATA